MFFIKNLKKDSVELTEIKDSLIISLGYIKTLFIFLSNHSFDFKIYSINKTICKIPTLSIDFQ